MNEGIKTVTAVAILVLLGLAIGKIVSPPPNPYTVQQYLAEQEIAKPWPGSE